MPTPTVSVDGFELQSDPRVYVAAIAGKWLLQHTTPSWRIEDPQKGFQRVVKEERARQIALAVLEQRRTFPGAIVLATDKRDFVKQGATLLLPHKIKFLVVDGQHRLWAQHYSEYEATYACMIHVGLTEVEMARLFLEINDNQKRVPSSLRWDLVRLVQPEADPSGTAAVQLIYQLTTEKESPLYQRIDLTGEQAEISLKQSSLAPEIKLIVSRRSPFHELSFDDQYNLLVQYLIAIRDLDVDTWGTPDSNYYRARVLRALLRLLPDLMSRIKGSPRELGFADFSKYLSRIDPKTLSQEDLRATQGNAGIKAITDQIRHQMLG